MKFLRVLIVFFTFTLYLSPFAFQVRAIWTEPFPPFSVEGNPDHDYFFSSIFPLFRYFQPRNLEIYENADRSRSYEDLMICPGAGADRRDYECNNQGDGCDGGEVDLCHDDPGNQSFSHTVNSRNGSCKYFQGVNRDNPNALREGRCEYKQSPSIKRDVKGTDFTTQKDFYDSGLVYPKIQSGSLHYVNQGSDNLITWGTSYLSSTSCDIALRQFVVLRRAAHTRATVRETGEWPLGWVDWGYQLKNGKTLLEVNGEIPGDISGALNGLIEGLDDFYLTAANMEVVSDVSEQKKQICDAYQTYLAQNPRPAWLEDLALTPQYPPSYRQGYVRPSICVWDKCCPSTRCPLTEEELKGTKRALYYDLGISQTYNAALDEMFLTYPLEQSLKIFRELITKNPLIRYLSSAAPAATPSQIIPHLEEWTKGTCAEYVPWATWLAFGTYMDYLDSDTFLDPAKKCPTYSLMPEVKKETAAAVPLTGLAALLNLIWGKQADDVDPVKYHLITIPDAMGQSIQEIKQPFYDSRDTLADLEGISEYNLDQSNIVEDGSEKLYAGESGISAAAKRLWPYYTCSDAMFSSQTATSVEAYALGTRIGCQDVSKPGGKCTGEKFAAIIQDSRWKQPLSSATQIILNSKMFEGGVLNPKLEEAYAKAEEETGVPCEVLAGHHFEEASQYFTDAGDPAEHSLANGNFLRDEGMSLEESAIATAKQIKTRPYDRDTAHLITAMSNFNGGGNSNCQAGFPAPIPYAGCPRLFQGEDDPYATNLLDSKHSSMYLLYCGDFLPCNPPKPYGNDRPGAFSVALAVYNEYTSKNTPASSASPAPTTPTPSPVITGGGSGINPAGTCGDGYVDTALGCLPYERTEFIMALLRLLVGVGGALSLMIMFFGVIQIMTAAGDSKKLQQGRELFTGAITGLLFLIFSVALLRLFAADILKLPGF